MNLPVSHAISEALLPVCLTAKLTPPVEEAAQARPAGLPAALAFLANYGVSASDLLQAALEARRQGVAPEAALLASGALREEFYYRCLAHRLGAEFNCGKARLSHAARYPYAIHSGLLPLASADGPKWLAAPR